MAGDGHEVLPSTSLTASKKACVTGATRSPFLVHIQAKIRPGVGMAARTMGLGSITRSLKRMRSIQCIAMQLVSRASHVLQIRKRIVASIAVDVIALHACWRRAKKSVSNQMVNESAESMVSPVVHLEIASVRKPRTNHLSMLAHVAEIAHLDERRESGRWQPSFSGKIGLHRLLLSGVERRVVRATSPHIYITRGH